MDVKSVMTIRWQEGTPSGEKQFCQILDFIDTYEARKQVILNALPITSIADDFELDRKEFFIQEGNDSFLRLCIYNDSKLVAEAEFESLLKVGESYFELKPIRLYPSM